MQSCLLSGDWQVCREDGVSVLFVVYYLASKAKNTGELKWLRSC